MRDTPATTGRAVLAQIVTGDRDTGDLSALDVADADAAWRASAATLLDLVEDHTRITCRERLDTDLDQLHADGLLPEEHRARFGSDQGSYIQRGLSWTRSNIQNCVPAAN